MITYIKLNHNEYDISNDLYFLLCIVSKKDEFNQTSRKMNSIETAKNFITANYDKNISIKDIAGAVHMSSSYFSKIFKETTDFSPYDYLLAIRLDKAKELLQQTDNSIESIAYKTGFNSVSNFVFFFKKQMGISPLKFRNIRF